MKGSTLFFGNHRDFRLKEIEKFLLHSEIDIDLKDKFDVMKIDLGEGSKKISIDTVREAQKFLAKSPRNSKKKKALIIYQANYLTIEAQNALLKTLEEPPDYAVIVLELQNKKDLLDTVVSRCRLLNLNLRKQTSEEKSEHEEHSDIEGGTYELRKIVKKTLGERLALAPELAKLEKSEIENMLTSWIEEGRDDIRERVLNPHNNSESESRASEMADEIKGAASRMQLIGQVLNDLKKTNVSVQLALENLLINM